MDVVVFSQAVIPQCIVTGRADGDVGKAPGGSVCFPTQGTIEGRMSWEDAGSSHMVGLPSALYVV